MAAPTSRLDQVRAIMAFTGLGMNQTRSALDQHGDPLLACAHMESAGQLVMRKPQPPGIRQQQLQTAASGLAWNRDGQIVRRSALPLYHGPDPEQFASCPHYQALVPAWYEVADRLKNEPNGTIAQLDQLALFIAPLRCQLYLFASPDLIGSADGQPFVLARPEDTASSHAEDFIVLRERLVNWLREPVYAAAVEPQRLSDAVAQRYGTTEPQAWFWNDNDPTPAPNVHLGQGPRL